jgi:hypothetical protein
MRLQTLKSSSKKQRALIPMLEVEEEQDQD